MTFEDYTCCWVQNVAASCCTELLANRKCVTAVNFSIDCERVILHARLISALGGRDRVILHARGEGVADRWLIREWIKRPHGARFLERHSDAHQKLVSYENPNV